MGADNDSDSTLRILIQLGVLGKEDAEAAKQLITETRQAGEGMGTSTPENMAGMEKYKHIFQEGHGESEKLRESIHGLHQAARAAGPGFAEMGHLMHAALNPVALITVGLIAGLETYFKWQERVEEKHREMIADLSQINEKQRETLAIGGTVVGNWMAQVEAVAKLRAEMTGLAEEIKRAEEIQKQYNIFTKDALQSRIDGRERELELIEEQLELLRQQNMITQEQTDLAKAKEEHDKKVAAAQAEIDKAKADASQAQADRDHEAAVAGDFSPEALEAARQKAAGARMAADRSKNILDDDPANKTSYPNLIKDLQEKINEWGHAASKTVSGSMDWNTYEQNIIDAKDQIRTMQTTMANARGLYPGQETAAAAAEEQYKTLQGLREKFEGVDANIAQLNQHLTDLQTAAPKKDADENTRYAMEQLAIILKDSGLNQNQIIQQGAAGQDDLRYLLSQGFTAAGIRNAGETALRGRDAGQSYDENAIKRLEELNRDQTAINRLNALLASIGENNAGMLSILRLHQAGQMSQAQEIADLQNNYAAVLRWMAQNVPQN